MPDVAVLCYHAVSEEWRAPLAVAPARLEEQVRFFLRRGYRPATLSEAVLNPPAHKTLAVTFDDGWRSILECAVPLLSSLGVAASVFVPTDYIDAGAPLMWDGIDRHPPDDHAELSPMNWDELRGLRDAGWEVGSHTKSHRPLPALGDPELADELRTSRGRCTDELGVCASITYPYGLVDERVVEATRAAGYTVAARLASSLRDPQPLDWPRVGIYRADVGLRYRLKASPTTRRIRASGAWSLLERARRPDAGLSSKPSRGASAR